MGKTKTIELENNFHNTSVTVRAKVTEEKGVFYLTPGQMKRVEKLLCGMVCGCDTIDCHEWHLNYNQDGSAFVSNWVSEYNEAMI